MTSICPWNNYESGTRLSVSVFGYLVKCCSSTARADRAEFVTGAGNHIFLCYGLVVAGALFPPACESG